MNKHILTPEFFKSITILNSSNELMFNVTTLSEGYSKKPQDWLDTENGKSYVATMLKGNTELGNPPKTLEDVVQFIDGNFYFGGFITHCYTFWLSYDVALPFHAYLFSRKRYQDEMALSKINFS